MTKIAEAIQTKDWRNVQAVSNHLADFPSISADTLMEILSALPLIVLAFPDQFIVEHKGKQIVWHRYELLIWEIGEAFRQTLKQHKLLRKDLGLWGHIKDVTLDHRFGKGRESFVMLLGQYGGREATVTLQQLLKDQEVQGHAVYALRILGDPDVQDDIRPFLRSPKTWVRNEAKKYFQKLERRC